MLPLGGIPPCIHQIWIGRAAVPRIWTDTIKKFAETDGFEFKMWREEDLKTNLNWDEFPGLWDLYSKTERLSGKCNLARYLILYQCGGIYIDADCVIVKPAKFVEFLEKNSGHVFMAWETLPAKHLRLYGHSKSENPDLYRRKRIIANSIIGSKKEHGFWKHVLEDVGVYAASLEGKGSWRETGPAFIANMYSKYKDDYKDITIYPMNRLYSSHWIGIKDPEAHKDMDSSDGAIFFQYGYSTNNFGEILKRHTRRQRRRQ